eukprot:gb/GEZN01001903.1/.p1 GENE.gb/GEZN01001903.1/~~gb/GEZN01001903.1/.p1  ORF type:complete len:336 (-),score=43.52 gb/GEZN01001903.1/:1552-2559(-)
MSHPQAKKLKTDHEDGKGKLKIMVTGASGLLGRAIMEAFQEKEGSFRVTGTGFSRATPESGLVKLDITNTSALQKMLSKLQPDVIIHSAAERDPNAFQDPQVAKMAQKLNVEATDQLAEIARKMNIALIYISTDYVFDGTKPPYRVSDDHNPVNLYGKTKSQGEQAVRKWCEQADNPLKAVALRVPVLYGEVEKLEESSPTFIIKDMLGTKQKALDDVQLRFPTYTRDIGRFLVHLCFWLSAKKEATFYPMHFTANQLMTKYGMAQEMSKVLRIPITHLSPSTEQLGPDRPVNSTLSLDDTPPELKDALKFTPFKQALQESLLPVFANMLLKSKI